MTADPSMFTTDLFAQNYTGVFAPSIYGGLVYGVALIALAYLSVAGIARAWPKLHPRRLVFTLLLFILFGAAGEDAVNSVWRWLFGAPLWTYQLYPAKGGNITYFFPVVWGIFGFYSYLRDQMFPGFGRAGSALSMVVFGIEAIVIELIVNIPFYALFGSFIFYYHPENLGPLSHFSCLQVVPFYMAVAMISRRLIAQQTACGFAHFRSTVGFYLMVIVAFGYL
jgi:hypothetical protein